MENNNSFTRIDVANAENSHELPKSGLITRMGRWFRKEYLAVVFAGGTALAAEGCVFDTSGLYLPERDAIADARPNDDSSIDAGDSSVYNDGGDGSTTPDGGDGSTTPDAGPDAQVDPEICDDGIDNNGDGLTDCEDIATCNGMPSATPGTVCGPDGQKHEANCEDGLSNDGDGLIDCADPDCNGLPSTPGTVCGPDGQKHENICNDGLSNDGDALIDCIDPDCDGKPCGNGCVCAGGIKTEDASACGNGIDDDGDGLTDCMDSNCTNEPCGTECECGGDGQKHQTVCDIGTDGDGDGWEGCVDADCQTNTRCTAFTQTCLLIPVGNSCDMGGGQMGICSEYYRCVDG